MRLFHLVISVVAILGSVSSASGQTLPYTQPSRATLNAKGYQVYAHWHSYRLSQYNSKTGKDEYAEMLKPVNTIYSDGREYDMGGLLRDRPFPRPLPPPADTYQIEAKEDIAMAAKIGIDAFFVNVHFLNPTDARWNNNLKSMFDQADAFTAANSPGFSIAINIDGVAVRGYPNYATQANIDTLAAKIASFKSRRSFLKMNGKFVIGAALPEQVPATYWKNLVATLQNKYAMPVAFIPCMNTFPSGYLDAIKPITTASNTWRMYHHTASTMGVSSWNKDNNIPFIPAVTTQDNRPKNYQTTETAGFQSQYKSWEAAINNNHKAVMILTWNDYAEGHHARPSTALQYAMYDLMGYYISWFKTRTRPAVSNEVIFYAHRMHRSDVAITRQLKKVVTTVPGYAPLLNNVYAVAFLKSPGKIQIVNGDGKSYYSALLQPGMHFYQAPLVAGSTPLVKIVSSDQMQTRVQVKSAFTVRTSPVEWEDYMYRAGGSNRAPVSGVQNSVPGDRY